MFAYGFPVLFSVIFDIQIEMARLEPDSSIKFTRIVVNRKHEQVHCRLLPQFDLRLSNELGLLEYMERKMKWVPAFAPPPLEDVCIVDLKEELFARPHFDVIVHKSGGMNAPPLPWGPFDLGIHMMRNNPRGYPLIDRPLAIGLMVQAKRENSEVERVEYAGANAGS